MSYILDPSYNLRISQAAGLAETKPLTQGVVSGSKKWARFINVTGRNFHSFFPTYHRKSLKVLSMETITYNKNLNAT